MGTSTESKVTYVASQVLVTGANGFLGSHIIDQFLSEGYKVRGTVRNVEKCKWLQQYFDSKYGHGLLSLVQVEDFTKEHCFDEVVKSRLFPDLAIHTLFAGIVLMVPSHRCQSLRPCRQ